MKLLLALAVAATSAGPVLSRPAVPQVVVVATADLDLASASGRDRLDRRIARAAEAACGPASTSDLVGQNRVRRCRADAVQSVAPLREALGRAPLAVASAAR